MLTTLSWSVHNSNIRLCCIPLESIIHLQSWALVVALWCTASSTWKSVWKLEMKVVASRIIPRIEKLCLTQQGSHVLVSDCGHLKLKLQCFISIYVHIFCHFYINPYTYLGFPGGSVCKESACNVGDLGSIAGLGRSPGEGNWLPTPCSGLENSMDWIVHGVAKSQIGLSNFHFNLYIS